MPKDPKNDQDAGQAELRCPKARDFVGTIDALRVLLMEHEDGLHGFDVTDEIEALAHRVCVLLRRLLQCEEFWSALWLQGVESAFKRINLGEIDTGEAVRVLSELMAMLGNADEDYRPFVQDQVDRAVAAFAGIGQRSGAGPGAHVGVDHELNDTLRRQALSAVTALRNGICSPLQDELWERNAERLFRKFVNVVRKLFGVLSADLACEGALVAGEDVPVASFSAETRLVLRALAVSALLGNAPAVESV